MTVSLRHILAAAATATLAAATFGTAASAAAAPDGLTVVAVRQSLLGTHTWYQQTYRGLPVLGGYYAEHADARTGVVTTQDGRRAVPADLPTTASVEQNLAQGTAAKSGGVVDSADLVVVPGARPALAWRVLTEGDRGTVRTLVDARSGGVLETVNLVKEADGSGQVFSPNPVVTLQDESLKDHNDKDRPAFSGAYRTVTLTQLNNSGRLVGAYARNVSNPEITSNNHRYLYNRSEAGFEQVMGYYSITTAQEYIHSLGFTDVNNSGQKYRTTGFAGDNSFYDPAKDRITFGTGGVDDAEDAEVIWHEYGHAIQDDQVPGFGSTDESGAIGEGFGDYWAFTMSAPVSANTATTPLACIADWDSVSYTSTEPHCLRRVDGTKVYPADVAGEVHDDGEIWSRGLFDIYNALGRTKTDRIVLEAQFSFAPDTTFTAAARAIVSTARALYGNGAANACTTAMRARGFL